MSDRLEKLEEGGERMSEVMTVNISDCEFDCGLCNRVHRYTDADGLYSLHFDLRTGNKRFSCVEAEA